MALFSLLIVGAAILSNVSTVEAAPASMYPQEPAALFRHLCAACHGPQGAGDGPNAVNLDPRPADLTDPEYMATATEQDLFKVIEGGGRALEITPAMPPWGKTLSRTQIRGLVAYVQSLSRGGALPRPLSLQGPSGEARCRVCHAGAEESRPIAPNLGMAGSKLRREWLLAFLRNPPRIRPIGYMPLTKARMPNFQFTEQEAMAVTDYLMTKKDLTTARADVGDIRATPDVIARGRRLFEEEYACDACHRLGESGGTVGPHLNQAYRRLQPQWIFRWLKRPQSIRPDSPMPDFDLSDSEARSLMAYILSVGDQGPPMPAPTAMPITELAKRGEALLNEKNCLGCHSMEPLNRAGNRRR